MRTARTQGVVCNHSADGRRGYAEFSDGRKGWYVVTEERPDGSLAVRPATSKEVYRAESDELAAFDPPPPDW